jgi:hypothetical protein
VTVSPQRSTDNPGAYRRPRPDLYTLLLVIALLAILVAILFLYLHMQAYNFEFKGGPPVVMNGERVQDSGFRSIAANLIKPRPLVAPIRLDITDSEFGSGNI